MIYLRHLQTRNFLLISSPLKARSKFLAFFWRLETNIIQIYFKDNFYGKEKGNKDKNYFFYAKWDVPLFKGLTYPRKMYHI